MVALERRMTRAHSRFGYDVGAVLVLLVLVLWSVVLVLDTAELFGRLPTLGPAAFGSMVLIRSGTGVAAGLPVAAVLAGALVARSWARDGRLVGVVGSGWSPSGLVVAAMVGGAVVAATSVAAREMIFEVMPATESVTWTRSTVAGPLGVDSALRSPDGRVAWLRGGQLAAVSADGVSVGWSDGVPEWVEVPDIPAGRPVRSLGADASIAALWAVGSRVHFWDRVWLPLLCGLGAGVGAAASWLRPRGLLMALVGAAAWRVMQVGAVAAVGVGTWPAAVGLVLPHVAAIVAGGALILAVKRRPLRM